MVDLSKKKMDRIYRYDVIVVGGGVAGFSAALGSAGAGAKTLLVERNPYLGGIGTHSGVASFCGFYDGSTPPVSLVGGVGRKVIDRLADLGEDTAPYRNVFSHLLIKYDIEVMKYALDTLIAESEAELLLDTQVVDASVSDGRIVDLVGADDQGLFILEGKVFVDATGDANLAHMADSPTLYGEDGLVQMSTLVMWVGGIDCSVQYKSEDLEKALKKAKDAGIGPLTKMRSHVWFAKKGDSAMLSLPNYPLGALDGKSMTEAECAARQLANNYVRALRAYMPGMENCFLLRSGPKIGIRESRRIVCQQMLTAVDAVAAVRTQDSVARGGWVFEAHDRLEHMSSNQHILNQSYFSIPIGCIKAKYPSNLWCAGRNIGVDHQTLSSVRAMGTCFATGQAAGVAAALTQDRREYNTEAIQKELLRQGALPI